MNVKLYLLLAGLAMSVPQQAAAYESTGYLKDIFVNTNGLVLFRLSNPVNQRPKCATNSDWDYQLDLSNPHASKMFSLLKMSEKMAKPVSVGYGPEVKCAKGISAIKVDYVFFKNLHQDSKSSKGNYVKKK